jgi:hypothetical protein
MKKAKAKSASTQPDVISDAELAEVLANSNWAKMERAAQNHHGVTTQMSGKRPLLPRSKQKSMILSRAVKW